MLSKITTCLVAVCLFWTACSEKDFQAPTLIVPAHWSIQADAETPPVPAATGKDAADDPAIWYNAAHPEKSAIIGTVKRYGLEVYDLRGRLLHSIPIGNPNNVDVRPDFLLGDGTRIDVAVCSDRSTNEVLVFRINPENASLTLISGGRIRSAMQEVYGICLFRHPRDQTLHVFVNGKDGTVEQYQITPFGEKEVSAVKWRQFKLNTQPEGMVADDQNGILYLGEEDKGVWKMNILDTLRQKPALVPMSGRDNPHIKFDIEGMSLYKTGDTTGYLIVSSQGNNSYAVFDRAGDNRYLGSFVITDGMVDGSAETDGLDICDRPLGTIYPKGLLVVQDGFNKASNGSAQAQNFKLIGFDKILAIKGLQ